MKFKIEKEVFEMFPELVVYIPIIRGFDNTQSKSESVEILRNAENKLKENYTWETIKNDIRISAYFDAFKRFGVDPEIQMPAHGALTKRVLEGGLIPDINPMVNVYNALSIAYVTPFGGEDLDTVYGDFVLKVAKGDEKWYGIGAKKNKSPRVGELVWGDDLDLSTKALNWRQCDRTKLTAKSKNGYFVMDGFYKKNDGNIEKAAEEFMEMAVKLFGGKAELIVLSQDNPEATIDFESKDVNQIKKEIKPKNIIKRNSPEIKVVATIKSFVRDALRTIGAQEDTVIHLEHPNDVQFGDYSTNVALMMAKDLKKNPRELAEIIKSELLKTNSEILERVEVAGPGFINFYLKPEFLLQNAQLSNELSKYGEGKTMVIDYSAPNIAKSFGIGHLRSTNIGQAIYNIYKILGWKTIGDNHLGDWGTQYGKLTVAIKRYLEGDKRFQVIEHTKKLEELSINDLEKLYVKFHTEAALDETLNDEGRDWFVKLENKDAEARHIWQTSIDASLKEFNRVYELLGVKIDYVHGESFYEDMLEGVIEAFIAKGITKESEGALIVEFEDMPPAMLRKSNGTTTYFTRDMATIQYRLSEWNPDLFIYEVGVDQLLHFKQVFAAAKMMGWEPKNGFVHVAHGLIRWTTGKFSTRSGDTIHLADVIDKAMSMAAKIAAESKITKEINPGEKDKMIQAVALGAIKFNDLSQDPKKDIIFDWDRVMSLEGDSGPYLQYTYSRCKSVLAKAGDTSDDISMSDITTEELALFKEFYRFEEKITEAAQRYSPAVVAEYLLTIARKFNEFYAKHKVVGSKYLARRIFLTKTTASILQTGLNLLGIETVERM